MKLFDFGYLQELIVGVMDVCKNNRKTVNLMTRQTIVSYDCNTKDISQVMVDNPSDLIDMYSKDKGYILVSSSVRDLIVSELNIAGVKYDDHSEKWFKIELEDYYELYVPRSSLVSVSSCDCKEQEVIETKSEEELDVYVVERVDDFGYDTVTELTIATNSEKRALEIASGYYGWWIIDRKIDLHQEQIISSQFNNG